MIFCFTVKSPSKLAATENQAASTAVWWGSEASAGCGVDPRAGSFLHENRGICVICGFG